jgi:hypothetical protein
MRVLARTGCQLAWREFIAFRDWIHENVSDLWANRSRNSLARRTPQRVHAVCRKLPPRTRWNSFHFPNRCSSFLGLSAARLLHLSSLASVDSQPAGARPAVFVSLATGDGAHRISPSRAGLTRSHRFSRAACGLQNRHRIAYSRREREMRLPRGERAHEDRRGMDGIHANAVPQERPSRTPTWGTRSVRDLVQ